MNSPGESHANVVLSQLSQLSQKLMRILRKAGHRHLHALGSRQAAAFINEQAGLLRQLGEVKDLLPFEQRVALDMDNIYTRHPWKPAQRRWLERLATQLVYQVIIDRDTINQMPAFTGGARQLNKVLGNQLDHVLEGLKEALWDDAAS